VAEGAAVTLNDVQATALFVLLGFIAASVAVIQWRQK
jgi:hypothetical protein